MPSTCQREGGSGAIVSLRKNVKVPSLPCWLSGKQSVCQCRRCRRYGFDPWVGEIALRRKWQPTPLFLPGEFHGDGRTGQSMGLQELDRA